MEWRQIMNAMNLQEVLAELPTEVSHAVEVVLKKIEAAEMSRARKDVSESLQKIMFSVNQALYRMQLGISDEKDVRRETTKVVNEEAEGQKKEMQQKEKTRRAKQLLSIETFLQSSLEREGDLAQVMQWLRDTHQELQRVEQDVDFQEVKEITVEWVEHREENIHRSMTDIQTCLSRLHHLCGSLFNLDSNMKKDAAKQQDIPKGSVWRWWRETKVDTKMVLRIQELYPPSAEQILADDSLGTRVTSDLSLMLGDMVKFLSCNKTMSMAFKFAQAGLAGLSRALAERTEELRGVLSETEDLRSAKADLEGVRGRLARLETENNSLLRKDAALSEQVDVLQARERLDIGLSGSEARGLNQSWKEEVVLVPQTPLKPKPKPPKAAPQQPPPPQKEPQQDLTSKPTAKPKEPKFRTSSISDSQPDEPTAQRDRTPPPEAGHGEEEETTYEEEVPEEEETHVASLTPGGPSPSSPQQWKAILVVPAQSPLPNEALSSQLLEQRTHTLMASFQSSVLGIAADSLSPMPQDGGPASGRTGNDVVKLHRHLAQAVREVFGQLRVELNRMFTHGILELPFVDESGAPEKQTGLWEGATLSPSEMLLEINQMSLRHEENLQRVDESVSSLMRENKISLAAAKTRSPQQPPMPPQTLAEVMVELSSLSDMNKQQACKMRLALDSLTELHLRLDAAPGGKEGSKEETRRSENKRRRRAAREHQEERGFSAHSLAEGLEEDEGGETEDEDEEDEEEMGRGKKERMNPRSPIKVEVSIKKDRASGRPSKSKRISKPCQRKGSDPREELRRYRMEMLEEAKYIEQNVMAGVPYYLGADSQRTNQRLLKRALDSGAVSSQLHTLTSDLITHTGGVVERRLVCLLRSYLAHRAVQQVRCNLKLQLLAGRDLNEGRVMKQTYSMLIRLDGYKRLVTERWFGRRDTVTHIRTACLARMLYLYKEIGEDCGVHLLPPLPCLSEASSPGLLSVQASPKLLWTIGVSPGNPRTRTAQLPLHRSRQGDPGAGPGSAGAAEGLYAAGGRPRSEPLRARSVTRCSADSGVRKLLQSRPRSSVWCDITACSVALGEKPPAALASATAAAAIPLLMEMDINHGRSSALRSAHSRIGREHLLLPRKDICSQ